MVIITQLIYIKPGQELVFEQFETIALKALERYQGQLLLRVRPDADSFITANIEKPYEIHLVSFPSENLWKNFAGDEERKKFLHLKEQSIQSVLLIKGSEI